MWAVVAERAAARARADLAKKSPQILLDGYAAFGMRSDAWRMPHPHITNGLSTALVDKPADIVARTMLHPLRHKRCKDFGEKLATKNV